MTLEAAIAQHMNRRYARLVGRGTSALYVALRALAAVKGAGEIILPDLICSTVLDGVLLAGWTPVLADVTADRYTLDSLSVQQHRTARTRAVLVAHLFGHVSNAGGFGVPLIEDAIQGLGGTMGSGTVGSRGYLTLISFDQTKMIGGRGGVVLTDDPILWDAIQRVSLDPAEWLSKPLNESARYAAYRRQLADMASALIRPFDAAPANIAQIEAGWSRLAENVRQRNEKAMWLHTALADLPLHLPKIRMGDAIWRYTFAAPSAAAANWIAHSLQKAGVRGSRLYPALSATFAPDPALRSTLIAPRLINLMIDAETSQADLERAASAIRAACPKIATA